MNTSNEKIRVAHFIGALTIGGAENQVTMLLNALDQDRFERHIITMHECEGGFHDQLSADIKVFNLNYRQRYAPAGLYRLYRYLRDQRIDVLHCHMYHAAVKGAWIGRLAGVSAILVSEHGKNTWKRWWHHLFERQVVSRWIKTRVAVSEDIRRIRIEQDGAPPDSVLVYPNAVNTNVPVIDTTAVPKKLGSLGRLVDAKDFGVLLNAVRILIDKGYDIKTEIAGEGPEREKLGQTIDELGLFDAVSMPGVRNASEFLFGLDIFVMSSKREGVPVALLEAMAHGLPIVATSVGGIPEVLEQDRQGLLSPASDPQDLADNIARMIDDEELRTRLAQGAREKVCANYGIEQVARKWESLYRELLTGTL